MIKRIKPFPIEISRDYFGAWLSGFVDGEGSFILSCNVQSGRTYRQPYSVFSITLRDDDTDIALLIQSYLQAGGIYTSKAKGMSHSKVHYKVFSLVECVALCENFRRFPLMAKKQRDFIIWKKGVDMLNSVGAWHRPRRRLGIDDRKWSNEMLDTFSDLCNELSSIREYKRTESIIKIMRDRIV